MTECFGQGYPLFARREGRTYAVVGWRETGSSYTPDFAPVLAPVDAPGGRASVSERAYIEGGEFAFSVPTPARELVAELTDALDTFERDSYLIEPYDRPIRLVADLRRLLERWSS